MRLRQKKKLVVQGDHLIRMSDAATTIQEESMVKIVEKSEPKFKAVYSKQKSVPEVPKKEGD